MTQLPDLTYILPELIVVVMAMVLLIYGVFAGETSVRSVSWASVLTLIVAGLALSLGPDERTTVFGGQFVIDAFARFMKWLVLLGSALAIVMSLRYNARERMARFEYPVLILFATLGMLMMISANDLIALYVGLELQSLSLYVIAAFRRDSLRSSEAGLKYFVLGALSSGMLLYGSSMIYGFAGSTGFDALAATFKSAHGGPGIGVVVGLVFVLAGLAFKVSAVPFHMWTPDVYEGAPTPVTAFLSVASKAAGFAVILRVFYVAFDTELMSPDWGAVFAVLAILSMSLGNLVAILQTNIKRMLAYSSVAQIGYMMLGIGLVSINGLTAGIVHLFNHALMKGALFLALSGVVLRLGSVELHDLRGLGKRMPATAFAFVLGGLSLIGVPLTVGFISKWYLVLAALEQGWWPLAVLVLLGSLLALVYIWRVVEVAYFQAPPADAPEVREAPLSMQIPMWILLIAVFYFGISTSLTAGIARRAAILLLGEAP